MPAPRLPYGIPAFLLGDAELAQRLSRLEPMLSEVTSQLCTARQFSEPAFRRWSEAMTIDPAVVHRKNWEWVFILQALHRAGMLRTGTRGLAFGTGREPIVSLLASYGVDVVATDAPAQIGKGWSGSNQHAQQLQDLHKPAIVDAERFNEHVTFEVVDMRQVPGHLRQFDFLWSSCALEHLGSLQAGIDFITSTMECLAPGGVAVHTTEFNLSSNQETVEAGWVSIYRKRDIEALVGTLEADRHEVWAVNYFPGFSELDEHVDFPPYGLPHIKVRFEDFTITSLGLVVQRAA
jgi:hypothetical protein